MGPLFAYDTATCLFFRDRHPFPRQLSGRTWRLLGLMRQMSGAQRHFTQCENVSLDSSQHSDEVLAQQSAREGSDGPAFTELVRRFQDRVWRICFRLMSNEHDTSDAAQEVFVRLFVNREKFAGKSKYSTWVHGVAVRTCLTLRRGRGRRLRRVGIFGDEFIESQPAPVEQSQPEIGLDLNQMLDTLDEQDRALLIMKYSEGYSYEELSEMFELSVSACKMRVSRAREKLKTRFPEQLS